MKLYWTYFLKQYYSKYNSMNIFQCNLDICHHLKLAYDILLPGGDGTGRGGGGGTPGGEEQEGVGVGEHREARSRMGLGGRCCSHSPGTCAEKRPSLGAGGGGAPGAWAPPGSGLEARAASPQKNACLNA